MHRKPLYLYAGLLCLFGYGWLFWHLFWGGEGTGIGGCPSQWLFHVPCPGCGATRACMKILQGEFGEAFRLNSNAYVILAALIAVPVLLIADYAGKRGIFLKFYDLLNRVLKKRWVLFSVAVVEGWILYRNFCLY